MILSPFLFIIDFQAIRGEFQIGCTWELLYTDDLALRAESITELENKFEVWKQSLKSKSLQINIAKTKVLVNRQTVRFLPTSGKSSLACYVGKMQAGIQYSVYIYIKHIHVCNMLHICLSLSLSCVYIHVHTHISLCSSPNL